MIGAPMGVAKPEAGAADGIAVVALEALARDSGMSVKTLRKQIATAERCGWLRVIRVSSDCYGFVLKIPEGRQV